VERMHSISARICKVYRFGRSKGQRKCVESVGVSASLVHGMHTDEHNCLSDQVGHDSALRHTHSGKTHSNPKIMPSGPKE
jgi:hypothetical protein